MSINALPLRLLNSSTLGVVELPGASYIPPAPASHTKVRALLNLGDPLQALTTLSAVRAFSYLYSLLGESVNTYEHLFAEQTLEGDIPATAASLRSHASSIIGILNAAGLARNFFLASSDVEQVAVVATALALSNTGVRLV
jgi:hypothetical protein